VSRPDDNLISYTGDVRGNVWRNGEHVFGPDMPEHDVPKHERVFYEADLVDRLEQALDQGRVIADVLKFSGVRNLRVVVRGIVPGGTEDCADFNNRCFNVILDAPHGFRPRGRYVSTIKGGSAIIVVAGPVLEPARVVEHDLGNWSDQSREEARALTLDTPAQGWAGPVRYRRLNATEPALLVDGITPGPGDYRRAFRVRGWFRPWFVAGFALLKRVFKI
jgi:hypothetical protein